MTNDGLNSSSAQIQNGARDARSRACNGMAMPVGAKLRKRARTPLDMGLHSGPRGARGPPFGLRGVSAIPEPGFHARDLALQLFLDKEIWTPLMELAEVHKGADKMDAQFHLFVAKSAENVCRRNLPLKQHDLAWLGSCRCFLVDDAHLEALSNCHFVEVHQHEGTVVLEPRFCRAFKIVIKTGRHGVGEIYDFGRRAILQEAEVRVGGVQYCIWTRLKERDHIVGSFLECYDGLVERLEPSISVAKATTSADDNREIDEAREEGSIVVLTDTIGDLPGSEFSPRFHVQDFRTGFVFGGRTDGGLFADKVITIAKQNTWFDEDNVSQSRLLDLIEQSLSRLYCRTECLHDVVDFEMRVVAESSAFSGGLGHSAPFHPTCPGTTDLAGRVESYVPYETGAKVIIGHQQGSKVAISAGSYNVGNNQTAKEILSVLRSIQSNERKSVISNVARFMIVIMDTETDNEIHISSAESELKLLGSRIREARLCRNLTQALVAECAGVGRQTVIRIEDGEEGVAIGTYATVLGVLGILNGWGNIADPEGDRLARAQLRSRAARR